MTHGDVPRLLGKRDLREKKVTINLVKYRTGTKVKQEGVQLNPQGLGGRGQFSIRWRNQRT